MAREIVYIDDLDGTHGAEPVKFGYDDIWWEIDLAESNRKRLEEALRPFLDKAHPAQVAQAKTEAPKRQRRRGEEGKIDYSSPEYAGNPHRGRATEAEAAYVREHLDEVNARLREKGIREINPQDAKMRERYGLS